jgi:hypothetical protein
VLLAKEQPLPRRYIFQVVSQDKGGRAPIIDRAVSPISLIPILARLFVDLDVLPLPRPAKPRSVVAKHAGRIAKY